MSGRKTLFGQLPIILYQGTLNQTLETKRITNPDDLFPQAIAYTSLKDSFFYVLPLTYSVSGLRKVDFGASVHENLETVCEIGDCQGEFR